MNCIEFDNFSTFQLSKISLIALVNHFDRLTQHSCLTGYRQHCLCVRPEGVTNKCQLWQEAESEYLMNYVPIDMEYEGAISIVPSYRT